MLQAFDPDVFALGVAVGVLSLVLLLSLVVCYAYDEPTLLFLAVYLAFMVTGLVGGMWLGLNSVAVQNLQLVAGPALAGMFATWLFRKRNKSLIDKIVIAIPSIASIVLLGYFLSADLGLIEPDPVPGLSALLCLAWAGLLVAGFAYRAYQSLETTGPWKWWLILGHASGVLVALIFLTNLADSPLAYLPVMLMLLMQVPPIYLSLVWRSRLQNEAKLRSASAGVADALTGLSTTPVLIARLERVVARNQKVKSELANDVMYLVEVQNWHGLLAELGADFNEKLLLDAAMRLRRTVGSDDMVARIMGGRFAVLAQGLADSKDITALATRIVVSGLRLDNPLLPGVELKFRVIVVALKVCSPLSSSSIQAWLDNLVSRFLAWPTNHRGRSILQIEDEGDITLHLNNNSHY